MARILVDRALPSISYSGGNIELDTIVSIEVTESHESAAVKTMNRRKRPIGYTDGIPDYTLELSTTQEQGSDNIWRDLLADKEIFMLGWQEGDNGDRYQAVDCIVNSVGKPFAEDGEFRQSVSIVALDVRKEPS